MADNGRSYAAGDSFELQYRSVVVLREHREPEAEPDHSVAASLAAQGKQPEREPPVTAGDPRRPASTYRLQITADFDLFEAARRLPYLHDLGVDWVYLSPLLEAEPGSTHGYDVVAFDQVDASRGGAEGLAAVSAEARRLGMGVLVDIVPNHVGVATPAANPWWWDVLEHGARLRARRGLRHRLGVRARQGAPPRPR